MADPTGFEPAISSVTGWHVGPLHHGSVAANAEDSRWRSGCRPSDGLVGRAGGPPDRTYTGRMRLIDLRSDTVTVPTDEMRRAMAAAEVGDDVFGDDPTVRALEERAAELLGKEAGLFVTSGTQGNLVAQLAHLGRGQETIAAESSHIVMDEAAGHAVVVGTSVRALRERPDGTLDPVEIDAAFRDPSDPHEPISGLVDHREHPCPFDGPAAIRRLHRRGRRDRSPPRRAAPRRRSPVLQRRRRARRHPGRARRAGRQRHVLPEQGPRLSGRIGRGRTSGLHLARAAGPEAGRWRLAPGRGAGRPRPARPARRPERDDRAPGRRSRQRPAAGRGSRRADGDRVARRDRPARYRSARPRSRPDRLRRVQGRRGHGRPSSTPSVRGMS